MPSGRMTHAVKEGWICRHSTLGLLCLQLPDCGSLECLAGLSVRCQVLIIHKTEELELKALAFLGGIFKGVLLFCVCFFLNCHLQ